MDEQKGLPRSAFYLGFIIHKLFLFIGMTKHRKQLVFAKTTFFLRKQVILAKLFIKTPKPSCNDLSIAKYVHLQNLDSIRYKMMIL